MRGLGTIINAAAILIGGGLGLIIKKGISEKFKSIWMQACGLASMFIGITGALSNMSVVSDGKVSFEGTILVVCSLAIGAFVGQLIDIETKLDGLGEKLKVMAHAQNDNKFVEGFVTVSLIVCIGAMAVMGSIEDGLSGDYTTLLTKSILDAIIALVFASSLGVGVLFSALSIGVYQGLITLLAVFIAPYLTPAMISGLSMVGSVLIFAVGINLIWDRKIHVGNMVPSIFIPIIYEILKSIFQ